MSALVDERARALNSPLDDGAQNERLLAKLDLAARDARDVEEVVDQPGHVLDLPLDDLARARDANRLVLVDAHDLQGRGHRRERVSELVAEHCEEFVFAAIDLGELVDLAPQGTLEDRSLRALRLEGGGLLLERRDYAVALVRLGDAVALGRGDPGVRIVDRGERLGVPGVVEMGDRVGAEKRERLTPCEVVPELLEPDGRVAVSFSPEQGHHLTEREDAAIAAPRGPDHRSERVFKALPVWRVADHELRERLARIERVVAAARCQLVKVEALAAEPRLHAVTESARGNEDGGVAPAQAVGHEVRDPVVEEPFLLVVLDEVPIGHGRGHPVR